MIKRVIFVALVLFGFVLSETTEVCLADAPDQLKNQARELMKARDYDEAEVIYKDIIEDYPGTEYDFLARKNLVVIYIKLGRYSEAEEVLEGLIEGFSEHSDLPHALYRIAKRYASSGNYEKAKSIFELIKQRYPDSSKAEGAQEHFRKVSVLSLIQSGNYTAAQTALDELIEDFSSHRSLPKMLYDIAKEYQASEKYEEAKSVYRTILTDYSDSENASDTQKQLISLYILLEGNDQIQQAVDKLTADYFGHPSLGAMLYTIAEQWIRQGEYDKAEEIYIQIIELCPDSYYADMAQIDIARKAIIALIHSGDDANAQTVIDGLIGSFANNSYLTRTVFLIGEEYYNKAEEEINQRHLKQAKEYYAKTAAIWERVITELPRAEISVHAYFFTARCYRQLRKYDKAIEHFQKVVDDWPYYEYAPDAQFFIGYSYERLRDARAIPESEANTKIRAAYQRLIDIYPYAPAAETARRRLERLNDK